ncbi:MAG: type II toxin-antitoxin system VapC family toxin [Nocardioidaceae bacterium]
MIIVDASVLTNALTDDGPLGRLAQSELARDVHWSGPEHLLVESLSAVRGRLLGGKIGHQRAAEALEALEQAAIELLPSAPLLRRMWELRANLTAYDAAYVAAAEAHGGVLVTGDRRLAQAPGLGCEVRLAIPA